MMIIHNPTDAAIFEYPIQDPETKKTSVWSIKGGETLKFPDHVGRYLLDTYGYLQRIQTQAEYDEEKAQQKKVNTGQHFSQLKVLKTPEATSTEVVQPPAPAGFTNELMQTPPSAQAVVSGGVDQAPVSNAG